MRDENNKYLTLTPLPLFPGHTSRVLHLAMSPDGQTVVSAAGDETLRFWKCFSTDSTRRTEKAKTLASTTGRLTNHNMIR